jgi:4-amino-4-deoxy-L-arabinose transferase-like glycosyltransferase
VAIVGPWVYLVARRDPAFIGSSLWKNVFLRTVQPAEQHSGPPGYYLLTIWVCQFPWSLILPAALFTAWRHRRVPALRFALAATIGPWLLFECIRTKLPHYLLPIYPALALMTADALVRASRRTINDLTNPAFKGVLVIWEIVVAALGLAPFLAAHWFPLTQWNYAWMALLTLAILHLAIGTGRALGQGRVRLAVARMGVRMLVCSAIAWGLVLPSLDFLQIPRRVAAALAAAGATPHDRTVMIDYKEPSLAFYQGGTIEEIPDKMYLADRSRSNWPRWIVTDRRVWELMPPRIQHALRIVAVVHGLNYADGMRIEDVLVIKNPAVMSKAQG